ncbi:MAG: gfo/Idh/MocA family oxidoreductase, partial [Ruminococcaceae bacterium]|nr:gfo/Idh/MocA family oxidoreductase [Oscillospiraceae bacterium]
MAQKKRYVQVGVGGRARFYYEAIPEMFSETAELTGFCDINRTRMEYAVKRLKDNYNYPAPTLYGADEFEKMIEEQKPDCV